MNKKGFTLIELLVVIAIIGVLSSIVLASVNIARAKGANAAIKQDLNGIRSQAEVYYDSSPTGYTDVCSDPHLVEALTAANLKSGSTAECNSSNIAWAVASPLKIADDGNDFWCVDSTGVGRGIASTLSGAVACP
jgi:prepilin-type N-terminal cleavage/methylation domain-containing protein